MGEFFSALPLARSPLAVLHPRGSARSGRRKKRMVQLHPQSMYGLFLCQWEGACFAWPGTGKFLVRRWYDAVKCAPPTLEFQT